MWMQNPIWVCLGWLWKMEHSEFCNNLFRCLLCYLMSSGETTWTPCRCFKTLSCPDCQGRARCVLIVICGWSLACVRGDWLLHLVFLFIWLVSFLPQNLSHHNPPRPAHKSMHFVQNQQLIGILSYESRSQKREYPWMCTESWHLEWSPRLFWVNPGLFTSKGIELVIKFAAHTRQ